MVDHRKSDSYKIKTLPVSADPFEGGIYPAVNRHDWTPNVKPKLQFVSDKQPSGFSFWLPIFAVLMLAGSCLLFVLAAIQYLLG